MFLFITLVLGLTRHAWSSAPHGAWDEFNFAPKSRTVYPTSVHKVEGSVQAASNLVAHQGSATLSVNGSWVALDLGVEVRFTLVTLCPLTELKLLWIGRWSYIPGL